MTISLSAIGTGYRGTQCSTRRPDEAVRGAATFGGRDAASCDAALRAPGRAAAQLCRGRRSVAQPTASPPGMTRHGRQPLRPSTRVRLLYIDAVGGGHLLVIFYLSVSGQSLAFLL